LIWLDWQRLLNHSQIFLRKEFRESFSPESSDEAFTTSNVAPPVDVYGDEHNITLKIEVPGIVALPLTFSRFERLLDTEKHASAGHGTRPDIEVWIH
jgi:hypothetical protein